jgi:hypothetical protein
MTVEFQTVREDFPPNLEDLKIQNVLLYFARAGGKSFEVPITYLRFRTRRSRASCLSSPMPVGLQIGRDSD